MTHEITVQLTAWLLGLLAAYAGERLYPVPPWKPGGSWPYALEDMAIQAAVLARWE